MDIPFEKVSVAEAKVARDAQDAATPDVPKKDWTAKRRAQEAEKVRVNKDILAWLEKMPPEVRPRAMAIQYPRIFNKIAALWSKPLLCEKYLDELMMDDRGTRQGFPEDVATELSSLKMYFITSVKTPHFDVWGKSGAD